MSNFDTYLNKRGITEEQMQESREKLEVQLAAYKLREARKVSCLSQKQVAEKIENCNS